MYDRRTLDEARREVAAWLAKWSGRHPRLCDWVEGNIEETFTFYRLPRQHHKNLKSTNMLERLNEELKRRTLVVRIFPTPRVAFGWSARSPRRSTRTGSKPCATSTWMLLPSRKRNRCGALTPPPDHKSINRKGRIRRSILQNSTYTTDNPAARSSDYEYRRKNRTPVSNHGCCRITETKRAHGL